MVLSRAQWGLVGSSAVRVAGFAGCVAEAHRLGHGPGRSQKPWGIGFQRRACPIYAQTLRPEYLRGMADASSYCAGLMDGAAPEDGIAADWEIVAGFLRSTSEALRDMPSVAGTPVGAGSGDLGLMPLPVLRYELFAALLSSQGVSRLVDAAGEVARGCESCLGSVPTVQELEWIMAVAVREPIGMLAKRYDTSTRGMYLRIEKMWERLGVANQVQGVALAVQRGWIAPPPWAGEND